MLTIRRLLLINIVLIWSDRISNSRASPLIGSNVVPSKENEFPSVVYLGYKRAGCVSGRMICAGTAVTRRHVLTAAHCITDTYPADVQVFAGSRDKALCAGHDIEKWLTYDTWLIMRGLNPSCRPENDIAVVTVARRFDRALVKPAAVAYEDTAKFYGLELTVAGWGNTCDGEKPQILQTANLTAMYKGDCEREIAILENELLEIPDHFLCTAARPFILTACGDSGSPLFFRNDVLVGVTKGTCPLQGYIHPDQVNIHINIKYYQSFIKDMTKGESLTIETM